MTRYRVWCKKRKDQYWSDLPYAPGDYSYCERLVEYYENEWGYLYQYRIEPTYVVLNQQALWA